MATGKRDYYEVLGLDRGASKDEIKQVYRKLALQYHPDRNKSAGSEEMFKEVCEAYAVLSDAGKKAQYDRFGHEGIGSRYSTEDIFRGADFQDIFRDVGFGGIFDAFFGRSGRASHRATPGTDLRCDVEITLEEVFRGVSREIRVSRQERCPACKGGGAEPGTSSETCSQCRGSGQVRATRSAGFAMMITYETCGRCRGNGVVIDTLCKNCRGGGVVGVSRQLSISIPSGAEDGSALRMPREGEVGEGRGIPGDLYVVVHVKPHPVFRREGDNLIYEAKLGFPHVTLGGEVHIPVMDGEARLKIPSGTQNGTVFRLKGKGLPSARGRGRGDELVYVTVSIPTKLNGRQRKLVQELSKEMSGEN